MPGSDLLLLADGRLPAGGHAHSGGLEQAVEQGDVHDIASMEGFLLGLLRSSAETAIHVSAAACAARHTMHDAQLQALDLEESARTPSASLRTASRAQGRQLLRAAEAIWPAPGPVELPPLPPGPHLALAQG
ncbi:MAG: urease accessory UreF family protein, partial [Solirubrobacteraceae bacterium]|nr:urease accessory UreF family protein [Solirubrobacteraceae bacterium]